MVCMVVLLILEILTKKTHQIKDSELEAAVDQMNKLKETFQTDYEYKKVLFIYNIFNKHHLQFLKPPEVSKDEMERYEDEMERYKREKSNNDTQMKINNQIYSEKLLMAKYNKIYDIKEFISTRVPELINKINKKIGGTIQKKTIEDLKKLSVPPNLLSQEVLELLDKESITTKIEFSLYYQMLDLSISNSLIN